MYITPVGARARITLAVMPGGSVVGPQQKPEHESMRNEEQWHEDGHNEVGGAELTRLKPNTIALIEGVKKIRGAPQVERPGEREAEPARQRRQRQQGENRGHEIPVRSRASESSWQIRRNDARHQERQADEPEAVQEQQWSEGFSSRVAA